MSIVVPAILPKSKQELEGELARFASLTEVEAIQIDVVDGRFAAPATWPYNAPHEFEDMLARGEQLPGWERFRYDIDLMVTDPEVALGKWLALGAARLTLHLESSSHVAEIITKMRRKYGHEPGLTSGYFSLGLAMSVETDLTLLEPHLEKVDYVQLMGIAKIGRQGQPFDKRVLKHVRALRAKYPDLPIQIDGGVSLDTAGELVKAGATRLVVGSALKGVPDVASRIKDFDRIARHAGSEALGYTGVV